MQITDASSSPSDRDLDVREHRYYVYILSGTSRRVLYTGVTNDLVRRLQEHRNGTGGAFSARYRLHRLIYFEAFSFIHSAIAREKQIKAGSRADKEALVRALNPDWRDLSEDWGKPHIYATSPSPQA